MTGFTYAIPVLKGHDASLVAALDDLPDEALAAVAGDGPVHVFVGEGELVLHFPRAERERFDRGAWREDARADVLRVLDEHTAFAPASPDRWLLRDVRDAGEPVHADETTSNVT